MNLLKETLEILKEHSISESQILWAGSTDGKIHFDWEVFKKAADKQYDSGYGDGGQEVAVDLVIVGKDFWLTREEYDGSEWWRYNEHPGNPTGCKVDKIDLIGQYGPTLEELNKVE